MHIYIYIHLTFIFYTYIYICSGRLHKVFSFPPATANIWDYQISSAMGKAEIFPFTAAFTHKGVWERKVTQQIHISISSQLHGGCQQTCTLTLFNWGAAGLGFSLASPDTLPSLWSITARETPTKGHFPFHLPTILLPSLLLGSPGIAPAYSSKAILMFLSIKVEFSTTC